MTVLNPPGWMQARTDHGAGLYRRMLRAVFGGNSAISGVISPADMLVTQAATPNMSVNVALGEAFVLGPSVAARGGYFVTNDGTVNVAISAANASLPRRDLIIVRVQDAEYTGSTNAASIEVVTGTAAASPADPSLPSGSSYVLARVTVAAGATTITTAAITDLRTAVSPNLTAPYACTSTTRPTSLPPGSMIFETDTLLLQVYIGGAWYPIYNGAVPPTVTTSGYLDSSGFTQVTFTGRKVSGVTSVTIYTTVGTALSGDTTGNVNDTAIGTLPAGWRPLDTWSTGYGNGLVSGEVIIAPSGLVTLRTTNSAANVVAASNLRICATYVTGS